MGSRLLGLIGTLIVAAMFSTAAAVEEIPKSQMTADASSFGWGWTPGGAIDGNFDPPEWMSDDPTPPVWLRLDLGQRYRVMEYGYATRIGDADGKIKDYEIYVTDSDSTNPADWGDPVHIGQIPEDLEQGVEHRIVLDTPTIGRYVIFVATSAYYTYMGAGEVWVYGDQPPTFIQSFEATDATSGSAIFTDEAEVSVALDVFPGPGAQVTGYLMTEAAGEPAIDDPGWSGTLPATYTITGPEGLVTLHAWVKDDLGTIAGADAVIGFSTTSPAISNIATTSAIGGVTVSWTTDLAAVCWLDYGVSGFALDQSTGPVYGTSHSITIVGLEDATLYDVQIHANNTTSAAGSVYSGGRVFTWDGNGDPNADGSWNVAANWDLDEVPGPGDIAVFPNMPTDSVRTVSIDQPTEIAEVRFPNDGSNPDMLGGVAILMNADWTFHASNGGGWWWTNNGCTINVNDHTLTFYEELEFGDLINFSGGGTIVKVGPQIATLGNWADTFTGNYIVQEGALSCAWGNASQATMVLHDGTSFVSHHFTLPHEMTFNGMGYDGNGVFQIAPADANESTLYTTATLATDSGFCIPEGKVVTLEGLITGPGGLVKMGPGKLILNKECDFEGTTIVSEGTLQVAGGDEVVLTNSAVVVKAGATLRGTPNHFPAGVTVEEGGTWDQSLPQGWWGNGDPNNDGLWSVAENWGDGVPGIDTMTALLGSVNGNGNSGTNQRTITCDVPTVIDELLMRQDSSDFKNVLRLEADLTTNVIELPGCWARPGSGIDLNGHTLTFGSCPVFANFPRLFGSGTAVKATDGMVSLGNLERGFTGDWLVQAGRLGTTWGWLDTGASMTISDGATVGGDAGTFSLPNALILNGAGDGLGCLQIVAAGTFTHAGPVTVETDATVRAEIAATNMVLNGDMDGAGTLTKIGAGKLEFNGTCTAAGIVVAEGAFGGTGTVSDLTMAAGTTLKPGSSIGTLSAGSATLNGAMEVLEGDNIPSTIEIEIIDPESSEGLGWDYFDAGTSLTINATASLPITVSLVSLVDDGGTIVQGPLANFDNTKNYAWPIMRADTITGFDPAAIIVDDSGFLNDKGNKSFSVINTGGDIRIVFGTPLEGDANMDCKVNILDLIFVRNRLNQDVDTGDNWQADANSDGKINILDLIYVRNRLNSRCE